jgi:hypothetical protein
VRYEDFVSQPRAVIESVAELVDEPRGPSPLIGERTVRLAANHTAGGNRLRFTSGDVELRRDDAWLSEQRPFDRLLTTALAAPMLRRYGYPLRPTRPAAHARASIVDGTERSA